MGKAVADQLQLIIRPDTEGHKLINASEEPMNVVGVTTFYAKVEGSGPDAKKIEALVTPDQGMAHEMLVGHEDLKSLKVISQVFPVGSHDEEERVKQLEQDYKRLQKELEELKLVYSGTSSKGFSKREKQPTARAYRTRAGVKKKGNTKRKAGCKRRPNSEEETDHLKPNQKKQETTPDVSSPADLKTKISPQDLEKQRLGLATPDTEMDLEKLKEEFKDVFSTKLGNTKFIRGKPGEEMEIKLRPNAVAQIRATTARKIPTHWEESANKLVQDMLDQGIISRVEHSIKWCSPSIFVEKSTPGKVRMVTDFTYLNQFVERPYHPFLSSDDVARSILPGTLWVAKADFLHGYFQLRLTDESSNLTTTILPGI